METWGSLQKLKGGGVGSFGATSTKLCLIESHATMFGEVSLIFRET